MCSVCSYTNDCVQVIEQVGQKDPTRLRAYWPSPEQHAGFYSDENNLATTWMPKEQFCLERVDLIQSGHIITLYNPKRNWIQYFPT